MTSRRRSFQRRRRRRPRLFRLDGAVRRVGGFLYHPPPRWGRRRRDKRCIHSNSGKRFTLAANHPPYCGSPRSLRMDRGRECTGVIFFFLILFFFFFLQTPKMSRAFLVCLGNRALATCTAVLTFLLDKAFLARLLNSFLITCSALRLTPRANPAFKPLSVLPGAFKGFRLLLSPWRPPRAISHMSPLPSW